MSNPTPAPAPRRPVVFLGKPESLEMIRAQFEAANGLTVKAVGSIKEALTTISTARPQALFIEAGAAQPQHIVAAKQLAELSASRKVPVVMFGGPLDPALDAKRASIGIVTVLDGAFQFDAAVEAITAAISAIDETLRAQQTRTEQQRRQAQIRQRLAQASMKLRNPPNYQQERIDGEEPPPEQFDAQALPKD